MTTRCLIRGWLQQQQQQLLWTCSDTFHQRSTRSLCSQTVDVLLNGDQQQSGLWERRLHAPMTDNGRCFVTRDRSLVVVRLSTLQLSALLHRSLDCMGGSSVGCCCLGKQHSRLPLQRRSGPTVDDYSSTPLPLFHLWKQVIGYNAPSQNLLLVTRRRRQPTNGNQTLNASALHIANQFSVRDHPVSADGRDEERRCICRPKPAGNKSLRRRTFLEVYARFHIMGFASAVRLALTGNG